MATGVVKTVLQIFGLDTNSFALVTAGFILLMLVLFIINLFGLKVLEFVSNISTLGKVLALSLTILAGIFFLLQHRQTADLSLLVPGNSSGTVPALSSKSFVTAIVAAFLCLYPALKE